MSTPLFPPPTPLLSALPPPNPSINQSFNQPFNQPFNAPFTQSVQLAIPQLSSSAPAELPSFQLEASAKRWSGQSGSQSTRQSNKGISLWSSSTLVFGKDQQSVDQSIKQSINQSNGLPLLATALQKQRNQDAIASIKQIDHTINQSVNQPLRSSLVHSASITQSLSHSTRQLTTQSHMTHSQSFSVDSNNPANSQSTGLSNNQQLNLSINAPRTFNQSVKPTDNRSMARLTSIAELVQIVCPELPINQTTNQLNNQLNNQSFNQPLTQLIAQPINRPLVVIDLDDTIYCQYHAPCAMMSEKGLSRYSQLINQSADLNFAQKTALTRTLQSAVSRKRGVEQSTIQSIKILQANNVPIVGLTARFSSMISATKLECAMLGIDLASTSPFQSSSPGYDSSSNQEAAARFNDQSSNACLVDGIIYTNAQEKGPILNRFLSQLWAPYLCDQAVKRSLTQSISSPTSPPLTSFSKPIPINPNNQTIKQVDQSHLSSSLPSSIRSINQPLNQSISPIIFRTSKRLKHKKLRFKFDEIQASVDELIDHKRSLSISQSHNQSIIPLPSKIVFVDDRLQNCVSVMNGLKVAQQLNIPLACYHYTPDLFDSDDDSDDDEPITQSAKRTINTRNARYQSINGSMDHSLNSSDDEGFGDRALAEYQIRHFIAHQVVLNDRQARKHRRGASPTINQSINQSPQSNSLTDDLNDHVMEDEGSSMIGML